ncbi:hypothetical protein C9J03_25385 [Photobacterium gaetbulicola]|uniref:hypothetical protein n=1 Tax=Photobacterium gaetbulicola TaxID=1295392 RepID=UPI000D1759D8|nr:hypothetical protein [Photobacterium gaetbulicola]PSU00028.1 hypothetical protein C9J03_25385 [Photobacterium gaetbulicola]
MLPADAKAAEEGKGWNISLPWIQPAEPPPDIRPFELPTLKGEAPHFVTPSPALVPAPKVDPDAIFAVVNNCYPEKTKFKIDLSLVAGMRSSVDQFDNSNWPAITDHYIGVVGEMPLYSTTEQAREREWEHKRRVGTAKNVATFAQALANRNHAYREMGLYLVMEARSQARVRQGIANITEQVGFLEKVAAAQRDILKYESQIVENRLALISMCDTARQEQVNSYLKSLAYLPPPDTALQQRLPQ